MAATELVTAEEMARRLRLKPSTILRWAQQRKIPSIVISPKVVRFDVAAVIQRLCGEAVSRD